MAGFREKRAGAKGMSPPVDLVSQGADFIGCAYHKVMTLNAQPLLRKGKEMSYPVDLVSGRADFIGCAHHRKGTPNAQPLMRR